MFELDASIGVIIKDCEAKYPEEACGYVYKNGKVVICENIISQLNQLSPDRYSRTTKNGYAFSQKDIIGLNKSLDTDNPIVLIYHSHPDAGAYFSAEDQHKAVISGFPVYPVQHLVVSVIDGIAKDRKIFSFNGNKYL
ncbi:Mov34/MPN/PAD-1 family protein [Photobacterium minamisatsumaniensis]|uniref:Mov34/MPN/PAD-1 family protein n=1 Tax=Photobacterium minamisatsumaniensis TaxID=2910233 RepID=UPI003D0AE123